MSWIKEKTEKGQVLVMGLGKSGLSALRFFQSQGARVMLSERAEKETLKPEILQWLKREKIEAEFGGHSQEMILRADLVLASPGVPLDLPVLKVAREKEIPVIGELALGVDYLRCPVVAVTGTNGKTTVTTLLGDLFKAEGKDVFVGGNIGTPLTDYLAGSQEADLAVLEVSSFQLDTSEGFRPDVGILLNISPDHLDRYASFKEYGDAKFRLFGGQILSDSMVVNGDDVEIRSRLQSRDSGSGGCFFFSRSRKERGATIIDGRVELILAGGGQPEWYELPPQLSQAPNDENSGAAILAARLMGCSRQGIVKGLAGFAPLAHRLSFVTEVKGVAYFDDSKATNIGALESALKGMTRPVILIAGGRDKGGDYGLLRPVVERHVKTMLLIGEAGKKMARIFNDVVRVEKISTLAAAVQRAGTLAVTGDRVLLSPACASFDQFSSYEERGRVFQEEVWKMKDNDK